MQAQVRALAGPEARRSEFASVGELRALSLRIFDRSFAVTYWLQAVAIAIGLAGIAAISRPRWRAGASSACWPTSG